MEKSKLPYHAQINFDIDVYPLNRSGELSLERLSESELESLGITSKATFSISGFSKEDCVKKIKQVLENLKYDE